jgi:uncharacterized coiled-coil protein SlyX
LFLNFTVRFEEQDRTITQLKKDFRVTVAQQQKQIEALKAGLQKVSDQLELNKPAPVCWRSIIPDAPGCRHGS